MGTILLCLAFAVNLFSTENGIATDEKQRAGLRQGPRENPQPEENLAANLSDNASGVYSGPGKLIGSCAAPSVGPQVDVASVSISVAAGGHSLHQRAHVSRPRPARAGDRRQHRSTAALTSRHRHRSGRAGPVALAAAARRRAGFGVPPPDETNGRCGCELSQRDPHARRGAVESLRNLPFAEPTALAQEAQDAGCEIGHSTAIPSTTAASVVAVDAGGHLLNQ